MLDRIYVDLLLSEWRMRQLEERTRRRRLGGDPERLRHRAAAWIGRILIRTGAALYGWGRRRRGGRVAVAYLPGETGRWP